jgi:UDP-N-acetylmuramate--alanine ligase
MKINLGKKEIIHFIGIGGIGMSGLALIMKQLGFKIQGSDISVNKNIERLKKGNIKIFTKHKISNLNKANIIVISSAIKNNNIELNAAKKKDLPIYKRGDMLAHMTSLKKNIVVAGSHGKTTTTSLIANVFSKAKLDPTIINGGVINSINNSAKLGKSEWCVLESDESDGSFIKVPFTYSIITNIDREHMDFYKSEDNLKKHFEKFISNVPSFGKAFLCIDDVNNRSLLKKNLVKNYFTYGVNKDSNFRITNIKYKLNRSIFDLIIKIPNKKKISVNNIEIPLIGFHNISNAAATFALTSHIGISTSLIKKSLKDFQGVERRFNKVFDFNGVTFFDDYAHHPTEIKEVLNGVKKSFLNKKVISIFQPHRISRLNDLSNDFSKSFKNSDQVLLCPVYKAGEKIKLKFKYEKFARDISKNSKALVIMVNQKQDLVNFFKNNLKGNEIVIGMGAGSISGWLKELKNFLKQ